MKNALALICIASTVTMFSACKGEKERQAEAIKAKESADLKKPRSSETWKAPDLSGKKPAKEEKK